MLGFFQNQLCLGIATSILTWNGLALATLASHPIQVSQQLNAPENICQSSFRRVKTQDGGRLNLRLYPSLRAQVIGTVPNGTEVLFNVSDRTGDWAEIEIPRMGKGWVATRFLVPTSSPNQTFNGNLRIKTLEGTPLNVRSEASLNSRVIMSLANGTTVRYSRNVGYWTEIIAPNGTKGFVSSQFLVCL